jgi:hypothetical protein
LDKKEARENIEGMHGLGTWLFSCTFCPLNREGSGKEIAKMRLKDGAFGLVEEFCFLLGVSRKFGELTNWTKLLFFGFWKERKIKERGGCL